MTRIREVQSLRAVAILLVAGYHYFASWTMPIDGNNLYPGTLSTLFRHTWLGVELFFMVSGFVISMTLVRSSSAREFVVKRVLRLWPALLLALPAVFIAGNLYGADIYQRSLADLFTSLTLIDPMVINAVLPTSVDWVTAVLWTMWIEIQFYALAALLFFGLGRHHFFRALVVVTGVATALMWLPKTGLVTDELMALITPALFGYLPWFLAGAIFHRIWSQKGGRVDAWLLLAIYAHECLELWYHAESGAIWLPTFFFLAFLAIARQWPIAAVLRGSGLVYLGEISYEFYLVHDTIGVTTITSLLAQFGESTGVHLFGAALGCALSIAVAAGIYRLTSPLRRKGTEKLLRNQSAMTASL
jgi:peptidoglycan/LPS O-acetylase OafA/YrhL